MLALSTLLKKAQTAMVAIAKSCNSEQGCIPSTPLMRRHLSGTHTIELGGVASAAYRERE